ncbi:MAG: hypothetical protein PSV46_14795 [Reyranella sp.]|nr:hypothetical protein [Reyranella sp.]
MMTSGLQSDRARLSTLFGLFFLSGAAALIYQTAWHRLLGLFAGADTIAAALVVGAFLLGLGIGSLVAGLLLIDLVGTAGALKLLVAIGLAFAALQLFGARSTRWAWLPAALLTAGLVFFPGDETFWRRLHGLTVEKAILAEDKTGLSVLKLDEAQNGKLYIQAIRKAGCPSTPCTSSWAPSARWCTKRRAACW